MYKVEKLENNMFKIKIEIDSKEWEEFVNAAYEQNKGKFNIQGFRQGKAPRKVIEQNYGSTIFYDDALDAAFVKEYEAALSNEKEIKPVANPDIKLEKFDADGIILVATVTCAPDVELGQYKGLEIEGAKGEVTEEQINAEIDQARERGARFVAVDRAANMGDFATIDFEGSVDGKKFDGGKAEDYRLELGSHSFIDNFEDQVVGMVNGEKKTIKVKFPENYPMADLKGKDAEFEIRLNKVEEKQLPELNDEFASNVSEFETFDAYKEDIKKHLGESLEIQLKKENEKKIIDKIVENSKVVVPDIMVEQETERFIKDFEQRLSYQGLKIEDYLAHTNQKMEDFKKDREDESRTSVKTRLVLEKILEVENLGVTDEELNQKIGEIATKYEKSLEDYKKSISERELIYFENAILVDKLTKFLNENNQIK